MQGLSSPLELGVFSLKNRIIMPPMAQNLADESGRATEKAVAHYQRHADGGSALIIVEHAYVTLAGRYDRHQLGIHDDSVIEGLAQIAETIHQGGAVALVQITHGGARCPSASTGHQPVGPSSVGVPGDPEDPRPLTTEEIEEIPRLFAHAARRALAAGFDGVEVHGAHGYLLNSFLSPYTNRRHDAYGGDLEGRLRLPLAVLRSVRNEMGAEKLLAYRLAADDGTPGGLTPTDAAGLAPRLAAEGVQLVDCSGGLCGSRPANMKEQGFFIQAAAQVRRGLRAAGYATAVSGVGGITDPAWADQAIRDELVDAVCVGRAQLKDPEWPRRALANVGEPK